MKNTTQKFWASLLSAGILTSCIPNTQAYTKGETEISQQTLSETVSESQDSDSTFTRWLKSAVSFILTEDISLYSTATMESGEESGDGDGDGDGEEESITYTITYQNPDQDPDQDPEEVQVTEDDLEDGKYSLLDPSHENLGFTAPADHYFVEWAVYDEDDVENYTPYAVGGEFAFAEDETAVTFVALWAEMTSYEITYQNPDQDPEELQVLEVKLADGEYTLLDLDETWNFTAPGEYYKFSGWQVEVDEDTYNSYAVGDEFAFAEDETAVTFLAVWEEIPTYVVSYQNDGLDTESEPVVEEFIYTDEDLEEGEYVLLDPDDLKFTTPENHYFVGWAVYDEDGGISATYNSGASYPLTEDNTPVVFVAVWAEIAKFTITFQASTEDDSETTRVEAYSGSDFYLPANSFDAPEKKQFQGWNMGDDDTLYLVGSFFRVTEDLTVTAVWEDLYTLTFHPGGVGATGTMDSVEMVAGKYTLPSNHYESSDFAFSAWEIDGTEYAVGETYTVSADATIKAVWDAIYQVTYLANGGTGAMAHVEMQPGYITLADCGFTAPSGKVFSAWSINDKEYPAATQFYVSQDTEISAVWANTYTVSFLAGTGTGAMSDLTVTEGDYILPEHRFTAPTGERFLAWSISSQAYAPGDTFSLSKDITLTALWEEIPVVTYSVYFEKGEGSGSMDTVIQPEGAYILPECGFTAPSEQQFKAWSIDGVEYAPEYSYTLGEDITITAIWEDLPPVLSYGYLQDSTGYAIVNATMFLLQNGETLYSAWTNELGYFSFKDVESGTYNMVLNAQGKVRTSMVVITSGENNLGTFQFTDGMVSSQVTISGSTAVQTVAGLEILAQYYTSTTEDRTLAMDISTAVRSDHYIYAYQRDDEEIALMFEIDLLLNADNYTYLVTETPNLLAISVEIPTEYQNYASYSVYRQHGVGVDKLTTTPNSDGEYILFNNSSTVTIYTKKFSTYALMASTVSMEEGEESGSSGGTYYSIKTENTLDGVTSQISGAVSLSMGEAAYGDVVEVTVNPRSGYELGSITAVNANGKSVTLRKGEENIYYFTQGTSVITLKVAFEKISNSTTYSAFSDVSTSDSFCSAVNQVYYWGLMTGTGSGRFSPYSSVTRGMMVAILYQLSGSTGQQVSHSFWDVDANAYYAKAVSWAVETGMITGYSDGSFRPETAVTREELSLFFQNYYNKYTTKDTVVWVFPLQSNDVTSISSWAKDSFTWCINQGIFTEKYPGTLAPQEYATRGEVAISLVALVEALG